MLQWVIFYLPLCHLTRRWPFGFWGCRRSSPAPADSDLPVHDDHFEPSIALLFVPKRGRN